MFEERGSVIKSLVFIGVICVSLSFRVTVFLKTGLQDPEERLPYDDCPRDNECCLPVRDGNGNDGGDDGNDSDHNHSSGNEGSGKSDKKKRSAQKVMA